jgi:hypothetical protein
VLVKGAPGLGRVLIWLSGASRQIVDECPTERGRYVGVGTAIVVTAVMAGVSLTFALVTALMVPLAAAIPFAIAWAIAILSLDRLFVVSLPRKGARLDHLLRATPRVLLALLLGFVISTPFVLQIFRPEIEQEITVLHAQAQQQYLKSQAASQLQQDITADTSQVTTLTQEEGGGGKAATPPQDAQIAVLQGQLTQAEAQQSRAQQQEAADNTAWSCQLYGRAPGSTCSGFKDVGPGPVANADHNAYLDDVAEYQKASATVAQLNGQINTERKAAAQSVANTVASTEATAKSQLPRAKETLANALALQASQNAKFNNENSNNAGLLIRMQALDAITAGNPTLEAARWLLFALFVVIDCMPVMIKVMLNMGPEGNYDRMLEAEEKKQLRVAASNRAVRQAAEKLAAEAVLGEAQSRLDGWRAPIPEVTGKIIAARTRVETRRLEAWESRQAMHPFGGAAGVPDPLAPPTAEAPVGFIAWPVPSGPGAQPGGRPTAALRHLGVRIRHAAAAYWRAVRSGRPQPGASQPPGNRVYGAPYSPGMVKSPNGSGPV